jgi:hypothetical protein
VETQLKRWLRTAGAVLAGTAVVASVPLWAAWESAHAFGFGGSPRIWSTLRTPLYTSAGEFVGCLLVLVLTVLLSDRFLGGRQRLLVGVPLTLAGLFVAEWFAFNGPMEGTMGLVYGTYNLGTAVILPLAAGAWTLRPPAPKPAPVADPLAFEGVWESTQGVLTLEPDAVFTLLRAGDETVAGVWGLDADDPSRIALKVVAPTALGQGWHATLLDVEFAPDGSTLLRVDEDIAYTQRPEFAEVEYAGGYIGQLEVLES